MRLIQLVIVSIKLVHQAILPTHVIPKVVNFVPVETNVLTIVVVENRLYIASKLRKI